MKSWPQLCQLQNGLVAAIQHYEKENRKLKITTVFTRILITDQTEKIKKAVFMIKQYTKLELLVGNASVSGTALSLRDLFCRELPSVLW